MTAFETMLDNIYSKLDLKNNNYQLILPDPILIKNGTKTIWKNIKEYLRIVNRSPDHFLSFLNYETSSTVTFLTESKSDGCIFQNKIKKDLICDLMKKYINEYYICKSCKSINTLIIKDKKIRKYTFICNDCKNNYTI